MTAPDTLKNRTDPDVAQANPHTIRHPGRLRLLQTTIWTLTLALPAVSFAADAPQAPQSNSTTLEEVVVTAQKRVERLHNVPISVAVLGGKELQKQNIININDIASKIPNVEVVLPFGPEEPQFSIRGVTETDFQPSQSSPVALYVDGTYKSVGALTAMALFDIDRIEVLRGPQGTLQGRNATGGAVNIYTVQPKMNVFDGYLTAGIGNFGRYETQGAINVPIVNDKLAVRAAWTYTSVDGYIHNVLPNAPFGGNLAGVDDFGGRISVLFKPTDNFSAVLRVNYFYSDPVNYGVYAKDIPSGQGIGITPGALAYLGIPQSLYSTTGYTRAGQGFFDSSSEYVHRRLMTNHSVNLEMNYEINDWLKLTSITGYDQGKWDTPEDDDGTPINQDEAKYLSTVHSYQEEARLTSSFDGPYNFIFGVLYDTESLFQKVHTTWAGYQPAIVTDPSTDTTYNICLLSQFWTCDLRTQFNQTRIDHAAYLHNTYKITDSLIAELGARYTDDSVGVQHYSGGVSWLDPVTHQFVPEQYFIPGPGYNPNLPNFGAITNPGNGAPDQTQTDHKWSGKAGLTYKITPANMVYASWSLGFRGSAFNGAATFGINTINAVQPETLTDYEVGIKNQFFDNRLEVDAAGFYYIYRNQQFATLNALTGLSEEYNLPKVNSKGLEFDILARPIPDVTFHLGGGYTYAVYSAGENAGIDIAGNRVEETPRWSFTTSVDWKILETDLGRLDFHLDGNAVTKQFYDALNSLPAEQNGYTLWNLRLTGESASGHEAISFWMQNIFDRHYFTSIFNTDASLNFSYAQRGLPRTFGVQATYRF
jgi:iron complex outermembrane recepter protein